MRARTVTVDTEPLCGEHQNSGEMDHTSDPPHPDTSMYGMPMPTHSDIPKRPNGQARPITAADIAKAWGVGKYFGPAILGMLGWLAHMLWVGGWINAPVNSGALQSVVASQANENSLLHNQLETVTGTLNTHSVVLGTINSTLLRQAEQLGRIEGMIQSKAPPVSDASAPAIPPPPARKKAFKSASPPAPTGGWLSRLLNQPR